MGTTVGASVGSAVGSTVGSGVAVESTAGADDPDDSTEELLVIVAVLADAGCCVSAGIAVAVLALTSGVVNVTAMVAGEVFAATAPDSNDPLPKKLSVPPRVTNTEAAVINTLARDA